jgi:hypothetical protein
MSWAALLKIDFSAKSPPSTSLSIQNITITSTHNYSLATSLASNNELNNTAKSDWEYQLGRTQSYPPKERFGDLAEFGTREQLNVKVTKHIYIYYFTSS